MYGAVRKTCPRKTSGNDAKEVEEKYDVYDIILPFATVK